MNKQELEKIKKKALEEHIPIIMDETLEVIEKYLSKNKPNRILEIGTAVGYSAICFTQFLAENGMIDTIERESDRVEEAKKNIQLWKSYIKMMFDGYTIKQIADELRDKDITAELMCTAGYIDEYTISGWQ